MSPAGVRGRLEALIRHKSFQAASGGRLHVLDRLALRLASGEVGALVGPSGCGKTTLLRIIAGLDQDYEGSVELPDHGKLGMVFQEPRLLPWRTLEQNVRLAAPEATDASLEALFRTLGSMRIAITTLVSCRSDRRGAWRLRARSRWNPTSSCSTSRSCRSTMPWRRGCARNWPSW